MKITLLGTNGWFDTSYGSTPCILVQDDSCDIFFDAGFGLTKATSYVEGSKPAYLFISHFHLDHLIGLHTLARFNFKSGLRIIGQPGTRQALNTLLSAQFAVPVDRLAYPLQVEDLPEAANQLPFSITALPLVHTVPCLGYRLELGGKVIAYCTDTGYCENAIQLARGADLLLCECSHLPGRVDLEWPHLNPAQAAQIASEAGAKKLVLIHFDPTEYTSLASRQTAQADARRIFPEAIAGYDEMVVEL